MTPEKFMARAIEIGRAGLRTKDARPFAAVVVRQGKIIGHLLQRLVPEARVVCAR